MQEIFSSHPYKSLFSFYITKNAQLEYKIKTNFLPLFHTQRIANISELSFLKESINQKKEKKGIKLILTSQLLQMNFLDSIFSHLFSLYAEKFNLSPFDRTISSLEKRMGKKEIFSIEKMLKLYFDIPSYQGKKAQTLFLRDFLMIALKNKNPALEILQELFYVPEIVNAPHYEKMIQEIKESFETNPVLIPREGNFVSMLFKPQNLFPFNLKKQIEYILENWKEFLSEDILVYFKQIKEKEKEEDTYFINYNKEAFNGGTPLNYSFLKENSPKEKIGFSFDSDWMPSVTMMAKSTLVWLHQLSQKYKKPIQQLQEIPEEELEILASQGFNALWLIGIWERSPASRRIKRTMGNPEAESSAYSLREYTISEAIGGWEGFRILKEKANQKGIRLASDMVPNHTGIDSLWIEEHPDYFLQLDHIPYPSYRFNQENLSSHPNLTIKIEDHYYTREDASVVFEVKNLKENKTRYIYHGNDGTSMPWNDTAQIDFLNPQAKEAVIQEIIKIAKEFPIIRFDAAMTLAKKHIQRLWHPLPQEANTIPSREKYGFSQEEFEKLMPQEFWREVVLRVEKEAPNTLLLAEAFWMLEGYFVRNLGLHRVYNSAFMNMLKEERNKEYRYLMKEVLKTDPEILKRFVNFMSNPDEETAVAQFGKGDKYFGICTLMCTLPGLPMFGHGQIEGLAEKYGMEYSKSYWQEEPDKELLKRHEKEIFPLLHRKKCFSEVKNFKLYDFISREGINENVFAYSNSQQENLNLVIYNNSHAPCDGFIEIEDAFQRQEDDFILLQDFPSSRWYIKKSKDLSPRIHFSLNSYGKKLIMNIHERKDSSQKELSKLYDKVKDSGFEGNLEEVINSYKKESQSILYWENLYKNDYLKNWASFNFKTDSLKSLVENYLYTFIELSHKKSLSNESFKANIEKELNIFWDKIQFMDSVINQTGENILLESWLSPIGMIFVYENFYKVIYPLLEEISLIKEKKDLLEEVKNKQLSSLCENYMIILSLMESLSSGEENEPLKKKPYFELSSKEKKVLISKNKIYIKNSQDISSLLKVLTSWIMIWQFYPERNNKKKKIDQRVKKFLEAQNNSLTKENLKSTL